MINITDKQYENRIPAWLRLGFRPFFLFGSLYAFIAVPLWVWMFQSGQPSWLQVPALWWHVHEMIFGFAMAIVAGFLLTAVQNWTGQSGTKHYRLLLIFLFWLAPRMMFWLPVPLWLISVIDALFLVMLAFEVGIRVIRAKGWRNLFFVPLLLLAIFADFASFATIKGMPPFSSQAVWQAMLWWFMLLLSVMGCRVIPFFTARRLNFDKPEPLFWLEWLANLPLLALFVLSFFPLLHGPVTTALMLAAGLSQLFRWLCWRPWQTCREPLLWSLHASYACIPASLLVRGLTNDKWVDHSMIHLFAVGALSGLILSMIARVTMGHTGRMIYHGPNMSLAFGALLLAALIRSIAVAGYPQFTLLWVNISALLWAVAFALFVRRFGGMLIRPRVDGHPG